MGLDQLLAITLPAVVALHPIAICLLLIASIRTQLSPTSIMISVTAALFFGRINAVHILDYMSAVIDNTLEQYLPLYAYYTGWIMPTIAIISLGWIYHMVRFRSSAVISQ